MTTFTPYGKAIPEGKKLPPKNLARMMAEGHPHCYVATTTVGYPVDLINKTRKGLNHVGAAFLHCYMPCQKGWVYQTSMTVEGAAGVVEAGLFPIWEYDPQQERTYRYFHPPVQRPVTDYLAMQGRFGHMLPEHVARAAAAPTATGNSSAWTCRRPCATWRIPPATSDWPTRSTRCRSTAVSAPERCGRCCSTAGTSSGTCRTGRPCSRTCSPSGRTRPARGSRCTPRRSGSGSPTARTAAAGSPWSR